MKKIIIVVMTIVVCLSLGCEKKENKKEIKQKEVGGWETDITSKISYMEEETKTIFENATKNEPVKYTPVALLATSVVSGTNYMFLCTVSGKTELASQSYKIVVIYNNLDNKATISSVTDFDFQKYINKDIKDNKERLMGGLEVNIPGKPIMIDEVVQRAFDKSVSKQDEINYMPICLMGHQIVSGSNYAVLAYGRTNDENSKPGIYLLTIYDHFEEDANITSSAYVDLSEYNKK